VARRPRGVAGLDEVGRGAWAGPLTVGVPCCAPGSQSCPSGCEIQSSLTKIARAGPSRRSPPGAGAVGRHAVARSATLGDDGRAAPGSLPGARRLDCRPTPASSTVPSTCWPPPGRAPCRASSSFCPRGRADPATSAPEGRALPLRVPVVTATPAAPASRCSVLAKSRGPVMREESAHFRPTASTPTRATPRRAPVALRGYGLSPSTGGAGRS